MKKYVEDFVDFGPGRPCYPSNLHVAYYKSLKQQVSILREDMLQVAYGDKSLNYTIDIGWYGRSFSTKGHFAVYLVKDYDWQKPLLQIKCKSIKRLVPAINLCLQRLKYATANFSLLLTLTE